MQFLISKSPQMKKRKLLFILLLIVGFVVVKAQDLTIDTMQNVEQLIENNLVEGVGDCELTENQVSPINGSIDATPIISFGNFTASGNNGFNLTEGILIATGRAGQANASTAGIGDGTVTWIGSTDYENAIGVSPGTTFNATEIEFDFFALQDNITFNYVFASDEYASGAANFCSNNDGVVILIKEAGSSGPFTNIALTPDGRPVTVANVHEEGVGVTSATSCPAENGSLIANGGARSPSTRVNYTQYTETLRANTNSVIGTTYTIKIIVADGGDAFSDSAVFIEKITNELSLDLGRLENAVFTPGNVNDCANLVTLSPEQLFPATAQYFWSSSVDTSLSVNTRTLDVTESGIYTLSVQLNAACSIEAEIEVDLSNIHSGNSITTLSECVSGAITSQVFDLTVKSTEALAGRDGGSTVSFFTSLAEAENDSGTPIANPSAHTANNNDTIFVSVIEPSGCKFISSFQLSIGQGENIAVETRNFSVCDSELIIGTTLNDADGFEAITTSDITAQFFSTVLGSFTYFEDIALSVPFDESRVYTGSFTIYAQNISSSGCPSNAIPIGITISSPPVGVPFDEIEGTNAIFEEIIICDVDPKDGFADFDLTPIRDQIVASGITGVDISFHRSVGDAQDGVNPIADPSNYTNEEENIQRIAVRVVNTGQDCPIVRAVTLKARHLISDSTVEDVSACDDDDDGFTVFDLSGKKNEISTEFEVELYASLADFDANVPITNAELVAFTNTEVDRQTIYVRLTDDDPLCEDRDTFDLIVSPRVTVNTPTEVITVCDIDSDSQIDGLPTLFQAEVAPQITTDVALGLSYYTNQFDASNVDDTSIAALTDADIGTSGTYWVRATSNDGCISVVSFQLQVNPAPDVVALDPIFVCYDRSMTIPFQDVTQRVTTADKNQFNVDYFNTQASAELTPLSSDDLIPISEVTNYDISLDEDARIWVRYENRTTGCVSVQQQQFVINTLPVIENDEDFLLCVNPGNSLTANFDLRSRDALILGSQTDKFVRYYSSSIADANSGGSIGEIINPIFSSTIAERPIYFRIENNDDPNCFVTGQFNLKIEENAATIPIDRLIECEGDTPSVAIFNLQNAIDIITNNGAITGVAVDFYANDEDAGFVDLSTAGAQSIQVPSANGVALPLDGYENQTPLSQEIVARITNVNGCVTFDKFLLIVDERPEVASLQDINICDTSNNGVETVNLRDVESTFVFNFAGRQRELAATGGVLYFRTESDRASHSEVTPLDIDADQAFEITSFDTPIYLRITSDSGCIFETSYHILLNQLPEITGKDVVLCEDTLGSNSFTISDLGELNNDFQFVDSANPINENVIVRYYLDAGGSSPLLGSFTKNNSVNEIFAEAFNTETLCTSETIVRLGLIANPIPLVALPDPLDLIVCDLDGTLDGVTDFDFSDLNTRVLNGQNSTNFTVSYHDTMEDADANIVLSDVNRATTKSYVARVTSNSTLCYNTIVFNVTVNTIPQIEPLTQVLERCDIGNDGTEIFNLNSIEANFVPVTGAVLDYTVRYYTTASRSASNEITGVNIGQFSVNRFGEQLIYLTLTSTADTNCTYESEFRINLIQLPQINSVTTPVQFCEGELFGEKRAALTSLLVPITETDLTITYHTDMAASAATEINDTDSIPNGQIYIKAVQENLTCQTILPVTLEEIPLPVINQLSLSSRTVCDDDEFNDGFIVFNFESLNTEILGSQSASAFNVTYHLTQNDAERNVQLSADRRINSGTYYVKVKNEALGCESINEIELFVERIPVIELEDVVFCVNNPTRLINGDTGNDNDVFYEWTFKNELGSQVRPTITGPKTIELSPSDIGMFVTLEVRNNTINSCAAFETFEVKQSQSAEIIIDDIIKGFDLNQVTIEVSSEGEYTYGYDDPDPANSQESNVIENVLPGRHTIWVFDKNGCDPSMREFVFIDYFPYFTPNGSGPIETETWHVKSIEEIPGTLVYIYDRFGKLLKTLTSDSQGWDGTFNGVPVPTDDYWVLIRTPDGEEIKDHITLKR